MNENPMQALLDFLAGAPALAGIRLAAEDAGPRPGTGGLWTRGVRVLDRREDVLGGVTLRCQAQFLLRLCLPLPPGDSAQAARNAGRLLDLAAWVAAESAAHKAPPLGDGLPATETLRAEDGRLERADPGGTGRYVLTLKAEYQRTL